MSHNYFGDNLNAIDLNGVVTFDLYKEFRSQQNRVLEGCMSKEVDALTPQEKFAICYCAGVDVELHTHPTDLSKTKFVTKRPCGIAKINGQFKVLVQEREIGHSIKFPNPHGCGKET